LGTILAGVFAFTGSLNAATLVADYEFSGNLSSSVAGAPDLVAVDPLGVASFTGGVYNWGGNASPPSQQGGLVFNSTGLLNPESYSVVMNFKFNERDGAWRRILDVQNRASDDGFYVDPSNNLDIFPVAGSSSAFTTGDFHTVILTVGGNVVTAYLDGVQEFSTTTPIMNIDNSDNPGNLINLFLDNTAGGGQGEWSSGSIDYVKFYDGVLTVSSGVPEPSTWALMLLGFAGLGFGAFRRSRKGDISIASA
jgi:hypothetical protein